MKLCLENAICLSLFIFVSILDYYKYVGNCVGHVYVHLCLCIRKVEVEIENDLIFSDSLITLYLRTPDENDLTFY